ncbi:MAG: HAMP domain-containing protein [Pirellulales bacterium]|nr:HAMP domain-containing protein [Pirellulales bacterium]
MANHKRKQLFVDPHVQGALIARIIGYWLSCLLTVIVMVVNWRILTEGDKLWHQQLTDIWRSMGPAFVVALVLLPIALYDILRLSNRVVGPIVRLRSALRALARGERLQPIRFRDGDFFGELAEEFNAVLAQLEANRDVAVGDAARRARDLAARAVENEGLSRQPGDATEGLEAAGVRGFDEA